MKVKQEREVDEVTQEEEEEELEEEELEEEELEEDEDGDMVVDGATGGTPLTKQECEYC